MAEDVALTFRKNAASSLTATTTRDGRWDGRGPRQDADGTGIFVRQGRGHGDSATTIYSRYGRLVDFNRVRSFNGEDRFGRPPRWTRVR